MAGQALAELGRPLLGGRYGLSPARFLARRDQGRAGPVPASFASLFRERKFVASGVLGRGSPVPLDFHHHS